MSVEINHIQDQITDAMIADAAFEGWSDDLLQKTVQKIEIQPALGKEAFPNGVVDVILYHSARADRAMMKALEANADFPTLKIREKIATAVMTRLEAHKHEREAIRRASSFLRMPWHMAEGTKALYRTVDNMWRAAGDTSTDYNFYSKRIILSKVYLLTLPVWFDDHTGDLSETRAFLGRRIENVMQFEKLKAQCKQRKETLKDWLPNFSRAS